MQRTGDTFDSFWSPFSRARFWLQNGQKTAELMLSPAPAGAETSQQCALGPDGSIGTKFTEGNDRAPNKRHHDMQCRLQNSACAGS